MNIKNSDKLYIYNRENRQCFFCGKTLKCHQITLDHYIPKSKKGTKDVFNLVLCCKQCNKLKRNKIPTNYETTILNLFLKAVQDNHITGCSIKLPQKSLKEDLLKVTYIDSLTDHFIFQSNTKKFYVRNNMVFKITLVSQN
ncbi:HNH endonuclease [Clostridium ganghwense]|uniref:HNH endonuclease n=1 Tax=Clostridium ganghwense TaxID=312089 RepID=A0ABT4CRG9_9CLOT|nr:HNH endonuclease [Clostridium ganghwense]MCY6371657.1 HNH endonuclease [Clostridium ganghwense]